MKTAEKIARKINHMEPGTTFKYRQLGVDRSEYSAAAKAIERYIQKGMIKRLSTGIFYKPKQTEFGELRPREEELLKPYLFENGKRIAYITGIALYNRMGLTSQVPKTIKVASRKKRITTQIGGLKVKPVKSYIDVTNENVHLLEILDALKDFKSIPDIDMQSAIMILQNKIANLSESDQKKMLNYALKYPPRTRALLGAIMDSLKENHSFEKLKESLNPLTSFDLGINVQILSTAPKWHIH